MTSAAARGLAKAMEHCSSLKNVDLRGNDIGDEGATAIAEAACNLSALTHLDLRSECR